MNNQSIVANVSEQNGLTRLTFSLPGDVVVSKNIISQINTQPFLLPVELIEKISGTDLVYSVGSLISLPKYFRQGQLDLGRVIKILREICDTFTKVKDNALYADNLSFIPDHVFLETKNAEVKMVLMPFEAGQQAIPALKSLLSMLSGELISPDDDASEHIKKIAEYCGQPGFKLVSFYSLLDELSKHIKPAKRKKEKRKKEKRVKSVDGFWGRLFGKKRKVQEQPENSAGSDVDVSKSVKKKRNGTELLLPEDEPDVITLTEEKVKTKRKILRLTISVNGMVSEVEITSFPCLLGRSPQDVNVILQDSGVSRKHAVIDCGNDGFFIYDVGSSNGIILNGEKLAPKIERPIKNGDSITIGRAEIQVSRIDGV